jgi:hypothetical protein
LALAVIFSFFCRNINDDKEANQYFNDENLELNNDEEYLHNADVSEAVNISSLNKPMCVHFSEVPCMFLDP